jgi:signal transduction histidine kinase
MLHEFLATNRDEILERARERVGKRSAPAPTERELAEGLPIFLDQLEAALRLFEIDGVSDPDHHAISTSARVHGDVLWRRGFSVAQVVHDYGDLCQVITSLAVEQESAVSTTEFRTLNLCLDDAIAGAVTSYAHQRECSIRDEGTHRLGVLAHEMRNLLNGAMLSFESIKKGAVSSSGATSQLLGRSLMGLRNLVDRSFADVRLDAGMQSIERVPVCEIFEEIEVTATVQALAKEIHFSVKSLDPTIIVEADRQILVAAVANLIQNAFKFTHAEGRVSLTGRVEADRVLIDVEDECGGLPAGRAEELFQPYSQRGTDRSGLGLGLSIAMKAVKACHGELRVKNFPGKGCVFTIDLPKQPPPPTSLRDRVRKPGGGSAPKTGLKGMLPRPARVS